MKTKLTALILGLVVSILASSVFAQQGIPSDIGEVKPPDPTKFYKQPGYSPYAGRVFPQ